MKTNQHQQSLHELIGTNLGSYASVMYQLQQNADKVTARQYCQSISNLIQKVKTTVSYLEDLKTVAKRMEVNE